MNKHWWLFVSVAALGVALIVLAVVKGVAS